MNKLINVTLNENQEPVVSGRQLHRVLGVKTAYKDWFPRMTEYGFTEGEDFSSFLSKSTGGRPKQDHVLKLDMAKEISMIQRTEKGKQARQYFLQVEKAWNNPEMVVQRALQIQTRKVEQLKIENEAMKPKAIFADAVSASHTSILVGELAKLLKQNGVNMGANRLFDWLRDNGFLIRRKGTDWNMPTQYSMDLGLFEIKETTIARSDGSISISKTAKVTGKGQQYFINKFLG